LPTCLICLRQEAVIFVTFKRARDWSQDKRSDTVNERQLTQVTCRSTENNPVRCFDLTDQG